MNARYTTCRAPQRGIGAALALMLSAHAAVAGGPAPAWEGYWAANARWCARAGDVGEETPDWYGRDGLFGLEWSCDVSGAAPTGVGQSWAMRLDCLDGGEAYRLSQIFVVTRDDRLLIIGDSGVSANLVRCTRQGE